MPKITISYRRTDSDAIAGRIRDRLAGYYGERSVFMDIDNIPFGIDFREHIKAELAQTDILVAVVGPNWLGPGKGGCLRINDETDPVRIEIETALQRGIPVIPVLVQGAVVPSPAELPAAMQRFAFHNAAQVDTGRDFHSHVDRLIRSMDRILQYKGKSSIVAGRKWLFRGVAAGGCVCLVATVVWYGDSARVRIEVSNKHLVAVPPAPLAPSDTCDGAVAVGASDRRCLKPGAGATEWFKDCPSCPEMVIVPAGEFLMGSPTSELGREPWQRGTESPRVKVTKSKPFAVGRFAVTFAEWDACVTDGGCKGYEPADEGWGRGKLPAINVSWHDAKAYVAWISEKTGKGYRLLSEAEREYVTRAGATTPFWWGKEITPTQANYNGNFVYAGGGDQGENRKRTVLVDSFQANPWGLYNVHGNVFDWTEDCWNDSLGGVPSDGSARSAGDCGRSVLRGGCHNNSPDRVRAAIRLGHAPTYRADHVGFRVARSASD